MEQFEHQTNNEKLPLTQEIADQIEEWFYDFETRFSLEKLSAISDIETARDDESRTTAQNVSTELTKFMTGVINQYDLPTSVTKRIARRLVEINNAVGLIDYEKGIVRHDIFEIKIENNN